MRSDRNGAMAARARSAYAFRFYACAVVIGTNSAGQLGHCTFVAYLYAYGISAAHSPHVSVLVKYEH